jgi:hypothetical protein
MRNLLRAAAVCALTLTALSTVEAATIAKCVVRCYPLTPVTTFTTYTTVQECCVGDIMQSCPSGEGEVSWNGYRCAL